MKKSKSFAFVVLAFGIITALLILASSGPKTNEAFAHLEGVEATVYKSPTCGCCDNFIGYLRRYGLEVERVVTDDMDEIKDEYGVPLDHESCHTTIIGGYTIEGHMPLEVIAELLEQKPDLKGIGLPGMPAGSPGMPGVKVGDFPVYSIGNDGEVGLFMAL